MSYLNVAEVETALQLAAGPANAGFTELITLPRITWEGRTCRAIRIHQGAAGHRQVIWEWLWRSRCEWIGWRKVMADCVFQTAAAVMI